ncbi:MAG: TrmB family transcriptional regulator [Candidatus Taylorbacteria bacterium]|nr:TrmB family transcriptional regulator [Candidatus Taylorbacteria bacterium]
MKTDILSRYGLNKNDIAVYDALLRIGRSKTGLIIRETRIVSSRVYESLRILVGRGLVSYQARNNIKYYQAESPDQLIEEASKGVNDLKDLAKDIANFPIAIPSRNDINIYEGRHGFKMATTQHVERLKKGEDLCIITFSHRIYTGGKGARELRSFFTETDKPMISKDVGARMIADRGMQKTMKKERIDASIYDLRYLPSGYFGPCAVDISKTEVLLLVWGDSPIAFSIKNPTIVASFQKNFNFLWEMAKKK